MLNLNFYSFKEKQPAHGEEIYYFEKSDSWGFEGRELKTETVEYTWDDGDGSQVIYDRKTDSNYKLGDMYNEYALIMIIGHHQADETDYWISDEDFWAAFDKADRV